MAKGKVIDRDRGWKRIRKELGIDAARVVVGILGDEKAQRQEGPISNVQIATVHEFGVPPAPERSFLRSTIDERRAEYRAAIGKVVEMAVDGEASLEQGLGLLGLKVVADVKEKIRSNIPPENSPEWKAYKESLGATGGPVVTLIHTGQMINSIQHQVRMGKPGGEEK